MLYVLRTQRNMRIHFAVAAVVLVASLILGVGKVQFMILLFAVALVMASELLNTAIETAIDITTTTYDPLARIAKDAAAAAVLVSSIVAVAIGYLIFFSRLNRASLAAVTRVRQSSIHLTVIALFLVIIVVIAAKAHTRTGTFLRGGWPSGHAALAGSLFTAITLISGSQLLATLALIMALLVFESRMEAKFHTYAQIISGAVIGVLVTALVFQSFYLGR